MEKMKWAVARVAILVMALVVSHSICATTCSTAPPPSCHQHHGEKTCDHVMPLADVAPAVMPAPVWLAEPLSVAAPIMWLPIDRAADFDDITRAGPILRI